MQTSARLTLVAFVLIVVSLFSQARAVDLTPKPLARIPAGTSFQQGYRWFG